MVIWKLLFYRRLVLLKLSGCDCGLTEMVVISSISSSSSMVMMMVMMTTMVLLRLIILSRIVVMTFAAAAATSVDIFCLFPHEIGIGVCLVEFSSMFAAIELSYRGQFGIKGSCYPVGG